MDKTVWERLTANFWLDTKIPISNDTASWSKMTNAEQRVVKRVFASLTMLDTLQSEIGAGELAELADTQHAKAVFTNIQFMESVHAKSYSTIFSTLCSTEEINELFRWAETDDLLQEQVDHIRYCYKEASPGVAFAASVLLESFLFYSGFYAPLRLASEGRLTNTADIIRLIMRDEGVHGFYTGYKYQKMFGTGGEEFVKQLLEELYAVELLRAQELYDEVGWTEDVKRYLRYNANKALANMGMSPLFPAHQTEIPAYIMAALDGGETFDFFSGAGSNYVVGTAEETTEEDWEW